jgi:Protein of unknown function (DUF1329)
MKKKTTTRAALWGAVFGACALAALAIAGEHVARADNPITHANWTQSVGFAPDTSNAALALGGTVHKGNVDKYAAYLPDGLKRMVGKYELKMPLRAYEPVHPSAGYIEATNKHLGKAKLIDTGNEYRKRGLSGYVAGLPFPKPKTGLEVAWDYIYSYQGDDGDMYYDVLWIAAGSGVEHTELWRWAFLMRTLNRTDLDPKPAIEQFVGQNMQYTSITYALEPYDKKGFGALYSRSVDPLDQQGHIYVPAMRRVLRNTFGTRGDTWNATDFLYEDVRGYLGYAEWMHWRLIGAKTMLMPVHSEMKHAEDAKQNFDLDKWPHWNPKAKWEPRPVYVVEARPKFPDYPYSKMIMIIDAETFTMPYKEAYDKKGELWKVIVNPTNASPNMTTKPLNYGASVAIDLQAEHATAINIRKYVANSNLDVSLFTLGSLRKRGH